MRVNSLFALLFLSAVLSACGGGGSHQSSSTSPDGACSGPTCTGGGNTVPVETLPAPYIARVHLGEIALKIAASNTHIFVAGPGSIKIVDIDTHIIVANIPLEYVKDLALSGSTLWVAMGPSGLQAFDVTNPESPQLIGGSNEQIERLAVNGNVWGAWKSDGHAKLGQLAIDNGQLLISSQYDVGKVDTLGVLKPLDESHLALSALLLSSLTEELRVVATADGSYRRIYTTATMNLLTDLTFRNHTLYFAEFSYGSNNSVIRSFELQSLDEQAPVPLAVRAGRYISFAWAGDALLAATDQTIYSLNPFTLQPVDEFEVLARPNMMLPVQDKHWIAFDAAGLVEAQFPAPVIEANQVVGINFGGWQNFTYNVFQGETLCQPSTVPMSEIVIDQDCFGEKGYVRLQIMGGELPDANNDGQNDAAIAPFNGELSLIVSESNLRIGAAKVSVLGDAVFRILGGKLQAGDISIEDFIRKEDALAKAWLTEDVNGDSAINRTDLLAWTPSLNNYKRTVFTESQVNQYQSALIAAANVEAALAGMTGALLDISVSDYPFLVVAANEQYLIGVTDASVGTNAISALHLMSTSNLSTNHILDTLSLQGYVSSLAFSGNYVHVGMNSGNGAIIQITDGRLSTVRAVPGCGKAAWEGTDLICANVSRAYRVDGLTGDLRWSTPISIGYLNSVYSSSGILAIDAGTGMYTAKLVLIDSQYGGVQAQYVADEITSMVQPFAIADGSIFTNYSTLGSPNHTRLERRRLDDASVLASVEFDYSRVIKSRTLANVFSMVSYDGLFTIGIDDLQIKTRHLMGASEVRGATLAGNNWIVLTDEGNLVVYGGGTD